MRMLWPAALGVAEAIARARAKSSRRRLRTRAAMSAVVSVSWDMPRLRAARVSESWASMWSAVETTSAVVKSSGEKAGLWVGVGEGEVHLGGAAAEKCSGVEVEAGVFSCELSGLACGEERRRELRGLVVREAWRRCRSSARARRGSTASRRLRFR